MCMTFSRRSLTRHIFILKVYLRKKLIRIQSQYSTSEVVLIGAEISPAKEQYTTLQQANESHCFQCGNKSSKANLI